LNYFNSNSGVTAFTSFSFNADVLNDFKQQFPNVEIFNSGSHYLVSVPRKDSILISSFFKSKIKPTAQFKVVLPKNSDIFDKALSYFRSKFKMVHSTGKSIFVYTPYNELPVLDHSGPGVSLFLKRIRPNYIHGSFYQIGLTATEDLPSPAYFFNCRNDLFIDIYNPAVKDSSNAPNRKFLVFTISNEYSIYESALKVLKSFILANRKKYQINMIFNSNNRPKKKSPTPLPLVSSSISSNNSNVNVNNNSSTKAEHVIINIDNSEHESKKLRTMSQI
jgi:hypothetical protein